MRMDVLVPNEDKYKLLVHLITLYGPAAYTTRWNSKKGDLAVSYRSSNSDDRLALFSDFTIQEQMDKDWKNSNDKRNLDDL